MTATTVPDTPGRAMTWEQYHEQGRRRFAEGDAAGAEQAFRGAIAEAERPGGDPLQMASSLSSLGQLKYQQKDYAQAEDCFRRALELREQALGADHPTVMSSINNLAALYVARGALDEAEPLLQRAMAVTVRRVEASQADLAVNLNNLVRLHVKRGEYARAEPLLSQLLALKRPLGPEHPEVAAVLVTLAKLRQSMSQPDAAERIWRRVLAVRERTLAPNDPMIATTVEGLADACGAQGCQPEELQLRERAIAIREAALGPDHPSLETGRTRVADLKRTLPSAGAAAAGAAAAGAAAPTQAARVSGPTANGASSAGGAGAGAGAGTGVNGAANGAGMPDANGASTPTRSTSGAHRGSGEVPQSAADTQPLRSSRPVVAATISADLTPTPLPLPTPASLASVRDTRRAVPVLELDVNLTPTPAAVPKVPPPARSSGERAVRGPVPPRAAAPKPSAPPEDVAWIDPAQVTPAGAAPAAPAGRKPDVDEIAPRRRLSNAERRPDRGAAADHTDRPRPSGRGKKVFGIVAAVTVVCAGAGIFVFGRDLFSGSASASTTAPAADRPASPASALHSSSETVTPTPPPGSVVAAPASNGSAAEGSSPAVVGHSPPLGPPVTTAAAVVPPRKVVAASLPAAKIRAPSVSARTKAVAPAEPEAIVPDVTPALPASINVDAATQSIDEATKPAPPKNSTPAPF